MIILQGDHGSIGSKPNTRMTIFNAYYLPNGGVKALHDDISPVNTFRVVFNTYFGGKYNILDDVSYFSIYSAPFEYTIIPNKRAGCRP